MDDEVAAELDAPRLDPDLLNGQAGAGAKGQVRGKGVVALHRRDMCCKRASSKNNNFIKISEEGGWEHKAHERTTVKSTAQVQREDAKQTQICYCRCSLASSLWTRPLARRPRLALAGGSCRLCPGSYWHTCHLHDLACLFSVHEVSLQQQQHVHACCDLGPCRLCVSIPGT